MKILDYPLMLATRMLLLALNLIAIIPLGIWIAFRGFKNAECRYAIYLLINFAFDVLANLIAPILPLFAKPSLGQSNNGIDLLVEPRLPKWLSWFMTPDNSLYGDKGWQTIHYPNYKSYTGQWLWLVRNNAHGLVNGPLAAKFKAISDIKREGNPWLSKNNPEHVGQKFYATCGNYFQYMTVRKIPTINRAIFFNIGWQFDPFIENPDTKNSYVAALKFSIKIGAKLQPTTMPIRVRNILISLDQFLYVAITIGRGMPDETMSSAAWRTERDGKILGRVFRPVIDSIFRLFGEDGHCYKSFLSEKDRNHVPDELK